MTKLPHSPLKNCLLTVSDPRVNRTKKHNLIDILVSTVCSVLAGMDNWVDIVDWCGENIEWLQKYLELPNGIASHDTYARVFSIIDPKEFESAFFEWVELTRPSLGAREIVSIDGKQTIGSKRAGHIQQKSVLTVSAWAHEQGISLGHVSTRNEKEKGEKKTIELLLDGLKLRNTIVTIDANGATPTIFNKVTAQKADIVVGLKNNQRGMLNLAKNLFEMNDQNMLSTYSTFDKNHGRVETRKYELLDLQDCLSDGLNQKIKECQDRFKGLRSLGRVHRERRIGDTTSYETKYFFTTLKQNAEEFAKAVRSHWGIENKLHWRLDVIFREDHNRARLGYSSENLGTVRRLTMNMLKKEEGEKKSIRRKRNLCNWRKEYLERVIFGEGLN